MVIITLNKQPPEFDLERQDLFKHKHHSEPVQSSSQLSEDDEYHDDELRDAVSGSEESKFDKAKLDDKEDRVADYSQNDVDEYTVS